MNRDRHDEVLDPWLADAFAELRNDVPEDVDWDGLHRSIHERAELVFARSRARQRSAVVRRPFVPIAVAASIALALWTGPAVVERLQDEPSATEIAVDLDSEAILREALGGDLTEQEFQALVTGRTHPEAFWAVAISSR